ncbi:MAG: hypothetical protein ACRC8S_01200 [Fimbriiglobus sp.]
MPVRFRCPNCETLLSIAKRKAGTEIVCPKCQDEVLVPSPDMPNSEPEIDLADEEATTAPETSRKNGSMTTSVLTKKQESNGSKSDSSSIKPVVITEPVDVPVVPTEDGMYLGKGTVAILAVLAIILVAMAFATGYLMGQ